jgi:hypothetical protein
MRIRVLLLLTLACAGGCAQVRHGDTPRAGVAITQPQITRIALDFSPAVRKQIEADSRFDSTLFNEAVVAELQSQQLLDLKKPLDRVAVIRLEDFDVHATSNLVLFGRLASAGLLAGSVRVRDAAGNPLREFHLSAEVPLRISQRGNDKNPLRDLYRRFAELMAERLSAEEPAPPQ